MSGSINDFTKWLASPDGRKVVEQIMKETNLRPEKYNKDINDRLLNEKHKHSGSVQKNPYISSDRSCSFSRNPVTT